jgi:hypothetical protein
MHAIKPANKYVHFAAKAIMGRLKYFALKLVAFGACAHGQWPY